MSSSLPLALAVLLVASGAVRAADPSAPERQAEFVARASVGLGQKTSASPADLIGADRALAEPILHADFGSPEQFGRKSTMPSLKVHLGRMSAQGRSPGAAPPAYGEVGIDVTPLAGLSIVPSYRVVLDNDSTGASRAVDAQVLKLGARLRF